MNHRSVSKRSRGNRSQRIPNFDTGVLPEPLLSFAGQHTHVDPKTGLGLYGPYSPRGQKEAVLTSIIVGIVGLPSMVSDAKQWLEACRGVLTNDGSEPFLYPHFPGVSRESRFQCDLIFGDTWCEPIQNDKMAVAIGETNPSLRLKHVISLYTHAIETLAQREPTASVILCCIPQMVIDHCMERVTQSGQKKPPKATKAERKARESAQAGQIFLFREMDPTLGIEEEEPGHQNLRRGLKAEAMQYGIPTQLVWPKALQVRDTSTGNSASKVQDVATRAWNFMTGLYHKAGGSPWRLADIEPNVCFVGISFYREVTENNPRLHTSMAQVFTSSGDGYVLRGNSFEWNLSSRQRSPHLDEKAAAALLRDVLDLYQRQNQGSLPSRMVVHKTSRYWDEELAGFEQACELIPLGFEFFREIYAWNPSFDGKKLYR